MTNRYIKNFRHWAIVLAATALASCEYDNYDAPDGRLTGTLVDAVTQKPLSTEQPNGVGVWLSDVNNGGGQGFSCKPDGTFNNSKVFAGTYNVTFSGPIHSYVAPTVEIKSKKTAEISVTAYPYVSFQDFSVEKDPNNSEGVIINFRLAGNNVKDSRLLNDSITVRLRSYRFFATNRTPYVGANAFDDDVSGPDTSITNDRAGTPVTVRRSGFKAGKTYYMRLGARTTESYNGQYNLTPVVTMQF